MNPAIIKIKLLCKGVRTSENIDKGRKSGAGPAGGRYFTLRDGTCVDIPLQGRFIERSPFSLVQRDEKWLILQNNEIFVEVEPVPRPMFHDKTTSDGIPMEKVALLHGKDCLASTVYSKCIHWSYGKQCKFCGIELKYGKRVEMKRPEQLGEVAEEAVKEGVVKHVTLTTGTPPSPDRGAVILAEAARQIKERVNVPIHVQLEPPPQKFLEILHDAGVDTVGIHIESFDKEVLSEVCPMKANLDQYLKSWKEAVELFGEGQVSSFIIAGLGESDTSILKGIRQLASLGVIPYLLPLRPIVGTTFEKSSPPPPERMISLYRGVCEILQDYGLNPKKNKAGCVRCGACSALNEFFTLYN